MGRVRRQIIHGLRLALAHPMGVLTEVAVVHAQFFIPQKAFYIILNVAAGGTWPGSPSASTVFPQRMLIYKPGA
ncbi:hypothetical protein SPRG_07385 [Saprolegnia parasitica CBS 223.65]|uniref:Uncharacterized protein n=1 Tax=Saprolegnia parasitica (strain CBS 223.65) TaxID=695850 RepID=A0A067CMN3_SAPPC|nr:hypothetical protein SPRG_07385 [Saprolegnia parasitica CBS 223.65]KDO27786.1 hypothetical protein SPRG_07385 [Saprolegnia parasitica CBS 223.65]|eukprot:XP_012201561.1 hypothetical protein SPRG_07385 [Saprolegnia parasitica CBS 223.65]